MPMTAEPSRAGFSGLDSTWNDPLSSWQLESLSDDLFTGAFHRAGADGQAHRAKFGIAEPEAVESKLGTGHGDGYRGQRR